MDSWSSATDRPAGCCCCCCPPTAVGLAEVGAAGPPEDAASAGTWAGSVPAAGRESRRGAAARPRGSPAGRPAVSTGAGDAGDPVRSCMERLP
eukprot:972573-Alexandrium_andersonii.AAC.1